MSRTDIQGQHECAVLIAFKEYLASQGVTMKVLSRPDPPDAIVSIDDERTWVELVNVFQDHRFAKFITRGAMGIKSPPTKGKYTNLYVEPDKQLRENFETEVLKKFRKSTLKNIYQQLGPGHLIIGLVSPFVSIKELAEWWKKDIYKIIKNEDKIFKNIYIYSPHSSYIEKLM